MTGALTPDHYFALTVCAAGIVLPFVGAWIESRWKR